MQVAWYEARGFWRDSYRLTEMRPDKPGGHFMRRVVVTGLGLVTPLGVGVSHAWTQLLAGRSGVKRIEGFDVSDLPAKIAGQVARGSAAGALDADQFVPPREQRR